MRVGLTDAQHAERKERLAQNQKIHEVAELVAKAASPDTITGQLAEVMANLHCIRAWGKILADYR